VQHPDMFEKVRKNDRAQIPQDITQMLEVSELQTVINGADLGEPLDMEILTKSAQMQA